MVLAKRVSYLSDQPFPYFSVYLCISVYTMSVKSAIEEQPLETETDDESLGTNGNIQLLDIEEEGQCTKSLKTSRRWKRWKRYLKPCGPYRRSRLKSCIIVILGMVVFFVAILLSLTITLLLKEPSQPVYNGEWVVGTYSNKMNGCV